MKEIEMMKKIHSHHKSLQKKIKASGGVELSRRYVYGEILALTLGYSETTDEATATANEMFRCFLEKLGYTMTEVAGGKEKGDTEN